MMKVFLPAAFLFFLLVSCRGKEQTESPKNPSIQSWKMHTIDSGFKGADGLRAGDANGDGLPDITVPFELSGVVRSYLNPGPHAARFPWKGVTAGESGRVEDSEFIDIDGDGLLDIVSCSETGDRGVRAHLAPRLKEDYLNSSKWKTIDFPQMKNKTGCIAATSAQIDGVHGNDLIIGFKNSGQGIGWLQAPADPGSPENWTWHELRKADWIMSLVNADMDSDRDPDILASDRSGAQRGVFWLENPGNNTDPWREHPVGATDREVMFIAHGDLDNDGLFDIIAAVKPKRLAWFKPGRNRSEWEEFAIRLPEGAGEAKSVSISDVNLDGRKDLVITCEKATRDRSGVWWMSYTKQPGERRWNAFDVSGTSGNKFDRVEMIDLDADGDPDLLTTEETEIDAVVWYENPLRP